MNTVELDLALAAYASATSTHVTTPPQDRRWTQFLADFKPDAYLARLSERGFRFLAKSDVLFPPLLRAIHEPPAGLFIRGDAPVELLSLPAIAVVGARACSGYGAAIARQFGGELARAGFTVVSGLARGIDGEAHRGVVEIGGTTVAVLGCGIDRDYPAAHAELARRIATHRAVDSGNLPIRTGTPNGLIVSEYAPGVEPAPWRFPARNRIIAGLCQATVVVEACERSGALITADLALEEGRTVYAVPGEITSALSAGTNGLLKLGATPATSIEALLADLGVDVEVCDAFDHADAR